MVMMLFYEVFSQFVFSIRISSSVYKANSFNTVTFRVMQSRQKSAVRCCLVAHFLVYLLLYHVTRATATDL